MITLDQFNTHDYIRHLILSKALNDRRDRQVSGARASEEMLTLGELSDPKEEAGQLEGLLNWRGFLSVHLTVFLPRVSICRHSVELGLTSL